MSTSEMRRAGLKHSNSGETTQYWHNTPPRTREGHQRFGVSWPPVHTGPRGHTYLPATCDVWACELPRMGHRTSSCGNHSLTSRTGFCQ